MFSRGYSGRLGCINYYFDLLSEIINPFPNDLRETMCNKIQNSSPDTQAF